MGAFLPDELEEIGLKDLVVGESVYTVPWAMYAERDGSLWLNGNYTFQPEPKGTAQMLVTRRQDGYVCDIKNCREYKWTKGGAHFVGKFTPIPIVEIVK